MYFFRGSITKQRITFSPAVFGMVFDITEKKEAQWDQQKKQPAAGELPTTDSLTKLSNKRALHDHLENEIGSVKRLNDSLSIVLFEIDAIQNIMETGGQEAADGVLKETAELMLSCIRDSDFIGRYSDTQFMIVYSWTNAKDAETIYRRIKQTIERHEIRTAGNQKSGGLRYREEKASGIHSSG
jgi:diguanylate cyclase (GGDEF)-like protein